MICDKWGVCWLYAFGMWSLDRQYDPLANIYLCLGFNRATERRKPYHLDTLASTLPSWTSQFRLMRVILLRVGWFEWRVFTSIQSVCGIVPFTAETNPSALWGARLRIQNTAHSRACSTAWANIWEGIPRDRDKSERNRKGKFWGPSPCAEMSGV